MYDQKFHFVVLLFFLSAAQGLLCILGILRVNCYLKFTVPDISKKPLESHSISMYAPKR